jgi:hypothetical protein
LALYIGSNWHNFVAIQIKVKIVILNRISEGHYSSLKVVNELKKLGLDAIQLAFRDKPSVINDADLTIRWGTSVDYPHQTLNSADEIKLIVNKKKFREKLVDLNINCPALNPSTYPLLVRPLSHTKKQSFHIANNDTELEEIKAQLKEYYTQEFLSIIEEYRVHFLANEPFILYKKSSGATKWTELDLPKTTTKLGKLINKLKHLNIMHGAFDLYLDSNGKYGVFECNTMPTIVTDKLAKKYAEQIIKILE